MNDIDKNSIVINQIKFNEIVSISKDDHKEGLVIIGAGEPHIDWITGLTKLWVEYEVVKSTNLEEWDSFHLLTTTGGRTDILMIWNEKLNVSRLTSWRWGKADPSDFSWLSDYIVNYADHY